MIVEWNYGGLKKWVNDTIERYWPKTPNQKRGVWALLGLLLYIFFVPEVLLFAYFAVIFYGPDEMDYVENKSDDESDKD